MKKISKKGKRILALALTLVLVLGTLPGTAWVRGTQAEASENGTGTEAETAASSETESGTQAETKAAAAVEKKAARTLTAGSLTELAASDFTVTLDGKDTVTYTGKAFTVEVSAAYTDSGTQESVTVAEDNYSVTMYDYANNTRGDKVNEIKDAGYYEIVAALTTAGAELFTLDGVDADGNLSLGVVTVDKLDLSTIESSFSAENVTYTGSEFNVSDINVTFSNSDYTLAEDTDYTVSLDGSATVQDAGDYTDVVLVSAKSGQSNVKGEAKLSLTVEPKSINGLTVTLSPEGYTLGTSQSITVTVTDGTTTLTKDVDYTYAVNTESDGSGTSVNLESLVDEANYYMVVTGMGNYTGTASPGFTASYDKDVTFKISDAVSDAPYTMSYKQYGNYYNTLTITPNAGYYISKDKTDINEDTALEFSDSDSSSGVVVFYIKNKSTGAVSRYSMSVDLDTTKPTVSASVENADDWTDEKTISITASDNSGIDKIYYSTSASTVLSNGAKLDSNTEIDLTEADGSDGSYSITVSDELNDTGVTYYIYAVDSAGNVSATNVKVKMIDNTAPAIPSLLPNLYWLNSEENVKEVGFTVSDTDGNSISSRLADVFLEVSLDNGVSYTKCDANSTYATLSGSAGSYTMTLKDAGSYRITATDNAGNETSFDFEVKKDTSVPGIELTSAENDAQMQSKAQNNEEIKFYYAETLTVEFEVEDNEAQGETNSITSVSIVKDEGEAINSKLPDMTTEMQLDGLTGVTFTYSESEKTLTAVFTSEGSGSYKFSLLDEAGNTSETVALTASSTNAAPSVELSFSDTKEYVPVEYNDEYWFNSENTPEVILNISDKTGIASVSYTLKNSAGDEDLKGTRYYDSNYDSSGVYYDEEKGWTDIEFSTLYADTIDANVLNNLSAYGGEYTLTITVKNITGKIASDEISFNVDKTEPSNEVYVECTTDVENETDYYTGGIKGTVQKFTDFVKTTIFGQETAYFTIYVRDGDSNTPSGIASSVLNTNISLVTDSDDVKLEINNNTVTTKDLQLGEDTKAYSYTLVRGRITAKNASAILNSINAINIGSIEDNVGNGITDVVTTNVEEAYIILDAEAPTVSISYNKEAYYAKDGVRYYSEEGCGEGNVVATLTYTEKFFGKNLDELDENNAVIMPTVTVMKNGELVDSNVTWGEYNSQNYTFTGTVSLPYNDGSETEYVISTSYEDGSGNKLTLAAVEDPGLTDNGDGTFVSEILVLDAASPTVEIISWPESNSSYGNYNFYSNTGTDTEYEEVTLSYSETYFEQYSDDSGTILPSVTVTRKDMSDGTSTKFEESTQGSVEWEWSDIAAGKLTLTVRLYYGNNAEYEYVIATDYNDAAGNSLTSSDSRLTELESGGIETQILVLDNKAPMVEVESFPKTDITYTEEGQVYNFYTGSGSETVELTYTETYLAKYADDSGTIILPSVTVSRIDKDTGNTESKTESTNNFATWEWDKSDIANGNLTLTVSLYYGNSAEYEYVIATDYDDAAGNSLTSSDGGLTPLEAGGFETQTLVLDNKAPTVVIEYPKNGNSVEIENNQYHFYSNGTNDSESITLTYTETYFEKYLDKDGEYIRPQILVSRIDTSQAGAQQMEWSYSSYGGPTWTWDESAVGSGTLSVEITLPYDDDAEYEYVITTSYSDAAGNALESEGDGLNELTDGGYESDILVLDTLAPKLTDYHIKETATYVIDGASVYANVSGDDVTLTFTVDDNDTYWDPSALTFEIYNKTNGNGKPSISLKGSSSYLDWENSGREHTAVYTFDGDAAPNTTANYYVVISYADRAGNEMTSDDKDLAAGITDGRYSGESGQGSMEFILDHDAPVFNISYTAAYRLVKNSDTAQKNDKKSAVPETGYTAYYSTDVSVTIQITEDYAVMKDSSGAVTGGIEDFALTIAGQSGDYANDITWTYDSATKTYKAAFTLSQEDYYNLTVSYKDAAGNEMVKGDTVQGSSTDLSNAELSGGTYGSETLVVDKTAPKISGTYELEPQNTRNGRYYFNTSTKLTVTVDDSNIRDQELIDAMTTDETIAYAISDAGTDIFKKTSLWYNIRVLDGSVVSTAKRSYVFMLSTEANYNIPINGYEDLAGNKAQIVDYNPYACVDRTSPTDLTISYSVKSSSASWWSVNYLKQGYAFANGSLVVKATAGDATAGIKTFTFYVTDEDGEKTTVTTADVDPAEKNSAKVTIPLSGSDFKGSIRVVVSDWSGNTSQKTQGQIVESKSKTKSAGTATITTVTNPSRTVNGVDYYNTDVEFNLTLQETYSGLRSYEYTAGSEISASHDYSEAAGGLYESKTSTKSVTPTNLAEGEQTKNITYTYSKDLTLSSAANNANDVSVNASYVSNTGYSKSVDQTYNIDVTVPTIEVTYDNNTAYNDKYYNAARTATVVITERNFDADDVEFTITNTDGVMPSISGWTTSGSGDATTHTATVTFSADGDYTFTLAFQDLAGNRAVYSRVDEFTIDQTDPTYTVTYDNNSAQNDYYYDAGRVATIDVYEHNFDASAVTVTVTSDGATSTPALSWSTSGDHNIATVSFDTDAEYTFTIEGMDLATNPMEDYAGDHFVVDTTAPEIEIFNVEDSSANNGAVEPGVRYSDTNYDANSTEVVFNGANNGQVTLGVASRTESGGSVEIRMQDFEYTQEMDDMYTMTATVYDLAGNSTQASIVFSVNRFGSVYTFDEATEALVGENGKYYTKENQTIVVIETNVDTLEESAIAKSLNGDLSTMERDTDYTVDSSGSEVSWKQYTYTLNASNFEQEGEYILTFTSTDRATNSNTNEKKVAFVVDKTAPTVMVSGVEDGGSYNQDTMDISINAADNVRLASVTVNNDGVDMETYEADTLSDGNITHTLSSKDGRQVLQVVAADAAGNESTFMSMVDTDGNITELSEVSYTLTTNLWVLFTSNGVLMAIAVVGILVIIAAFWFLLFGKKRRKNQEE